MNRPVGGGNNRRSRRAVCEQHKYGSVRGAPGRLGVPTRRASSTNNHQEVKVHTRGPSEGTRSRGDKGPRATEGLVEVVGTGPFRAKAKRRKASASGELALSSKALFPSVAQAYWRRDGLKMVVLTWRDLLGPGREAGIREDEEDGRRWPSRSRKDA